MGNAAFSTANSLSCFNFTCVPKRGMLSGLQIKFEGFFFLFTKAFNIASRDKLIYLRLPEIFQCLL